MMWSSARPNSVDTFQLNLKLSSESQSVSADGSYLATGIWEAPPATSRVTVPLRVCMGLREVWSSIIWLVVYLKKHGELRSWRFQMFLRALSLEVGALAKPWRGEAAEALGSAPSLLKATPSSRSSI